WLRSDSRERFEWRHTQFRQSLSLLPSPDFLSQSPMDYPGEKKEGMEN
ncbi:hypothetical protein CCACVL1_30927, partial [Corchorus capsularis]